MSDWAWKMIKKSKNKIDMDSVREAIDELNTAADDESALQGDDMHGFWGNIVQAIYNNPPDDGTHDLIARELNPDVFDMLKDNFGPEDVEMPVAKKGGRRPRQTRRKGTKKSTRRNRMRSKKH